MLFSLLELLAEARRSFSFSLFSSPFFYIFRLFISLGFILGNFCSAFFFYFFFINIEWIYTVGACHAFLQFDLSVWEQRCIWCSLRALCFNFSDFIFHFWEFYLVLSNLLFLECACLFFSHGVCPGLFIVLNVLVLLSITNPCGIWGSWASPLLFVLSSKSCSGSINSPGFVLWVTGCSWWLGWESPVWLGPRGRPLEVCLCFAQIFRT